MASKTSGPTPRSARAAGTTGGWATALRGQKESQRVAQPQDTTGLQRWHSRAPRRSSKVPGEVFSSSHMPSNEVFGGAEWDDMGHMQYSQQAPQSSFYGHQRQQQRHQQQHQQYQHVAYDGVIKGLHEYIHNAENAPITRSGHQQPYTTTSPVSPVHASSRPSPYSAHVHGSPGHTPYPAPYRQHPPLLQGQMPATPLVQGQMPATPLLPTHHNQHQHGYNAAAAYHQRSPPPHVQHRHHVPASPPANTQQYTHTHTHTQHDQNGSFLPRQAPNANVTSPVQAHAGRWKLSPVTEHRMDPTIYDRARQHDS